MNTNYNLCLELTKKLAAEPELDATIRDVLSGTSLVVLDRVPGRPPIVAERYDDAKAYSRVLFGRLVSDTVCLGETDDIISPDETDDSMSLHGYLLTCCRADPQRLVPTYAAAAMAERFCAEQGDLGAVCLIDELQRDLLGLAFAADVAVQQRMLQLAAAVK